jgi:hypothetical protein
MITAVRKMLRDVFTVWKQFATKERQRCICFVGPQVLLSHCQPDTVPLALAAMLAAYDTSAAHDNG